MPILDILESIITIIALVVLVIYISYKKKSQRVRLKLAIFLVILGIVSGACYTVDTIYSHRKFDSLNKAIQAYDNKAEVIGILQGNDSTYVILDKEGTSEGYIFPKHGKKWELPETSFFAESVCYREGKISVNMQSIGLHGEWYVMISTNSLEDRYTITDVKDSEKTEFLKTENNETIYYGYLKTKPKKYWVSVNGEKIPINYRKLLDNFIPDDSLDSDYAEISEELKNITDEKEFIKKYIHR